MAKRRLLEWMRDRLNAHVSEKVDPPLERRAMDAAYRKLAPAVTRVVQKKYKPTDMAVLEKYEVARRDTCVTLTLPDARVVQFRYRTEEEAPTVAATRDCCSRMYLADESLAQLYDAHWKAAEAHKNETKRRVEAYRTLVKFAVTVEDVVEVWPEAAQILPATALSAPLTDAQLALIRADTSERAAA